MRIAMLGTRGVPAQYGGFETAVEEIGSRLAERGHDVHVYTRNLGKPLDNYRGMHLHKVPALRRASLETISHTMFSACHCAARVKPECAFVFNVANAPMARMLSRAGVPTAIHIDGLEWARSKWSGMGSRYFRWAEAHAAASSLPLIADAEAIRRYVRERYDRDSVMIPYGSSSVQVDEGHLSQCGLRREQFHLVVARFEPENHVVDILRGYHDARDLRWPMVVVGGAPYSRRYQAQVAAIAASDRRIRLLGNIWDQELLNSLYGGALAYCHGHSVGGTNPSLLRALGAGTFVVAHDNPFNREVAGERALFFKAEGEVGDRLRQLERNASVMKVMALENRARVLRSYKWSRVSDKYEDLARNLAQGKLCHD